MFFQQPFRCPSVFLICPAASSRVEVPRPFVTWNKNRGRRGESFFLLFQGAKWQFFGGWFVRTDDFGTRHFCVGRFFLIQKELELVTCWNTNQGFLKIRNFHALWLLIFARICLVGKSQEKMPISQQHAHVQLIVLSSFLWSWQTRKPEQNACSKKENSAGWKFSLGF